MNEKQANMTFNPDTLNYSAFSDKTITKSRFTREQLQAANIEKASYDQNIFGALHIFGNDKKSKIMLYSGVVLAIVLISVIIGMISSSSGVSSELVAAPMIAVLALLVLGRYVSRYVFSTIRRLRLLRFALDNGFRYAATREPSQEQGMMFGMSSPTVVSDTLTISDALSISAYNYTYSYGGRGDTTYYVNFAKIRLSRSVPSIYIDGKKNMIGIDVSNFAVQKVNLEGDFGNYFSVYAPPQYQVDALQLLTPDVMALLSDHGTNYDYELVDGYLYVYAKANTLYAPDRVRNLLKMTMLLFLELNKQAGVYSDARVASTNTGNIAPQGASVRTRFWNVVTITLVAIFTAFFLSSGLYLFAVQNVSGALILLVLMVIIDVTIIGSRYFSQKMS